MKPVPFSPDSHNRLDQFQINWHALITSGVSFQSEAGFTYLEQIKKYCNNGGIPAGITACVFEYQQNPEFERLLSVLHDRPFLQKDFVPALLAGSGIADFLAHFEKDPVALRAKVQEAKFEWVSSFRIEGILSEYLYRYGMYDFFYHHSTPADAVNITRKFASDLWGGDPENVICFATRSSWGAWFDPHSCSDYSFVFISRKERFIWLFCFSHSD